MSGSLKLKAEQNSYILATHFATNWLELPPRVTLNSTNPLHLILTKAFSTDRRSVSPFTKEDYPCRDDVIQFDLSTCKPTWSDNVDFFFTLTKVWNRDGSSQLISNNKVSIKLNAEATTAIGQKFTPTHYTNDDYTTFLSRSKKQWIFSSALGPPGLVYYNRSVIVPKLSSSSHFLSLSWARSLNVEPKIALSF